MGDSENAVFRNLGAIFREDDHRIGTETGLVNGTNEPSSLADLAGPALVANCCVQRRRRVTCAKQRPKSEILVKTVPPAPSGPPERRTSSQPHIRSTSAAIGHQTASGFVTAADIWLITAAPGRSRLRPDLSQISISRCYWNRFTQMSARVAATTIFSAYPARSGGYDGRAFGLSACSKIREEHGDTESRFASDEALRWAIPEEQAFSPTA